MTDSAGQLVQIGDTKPDTGQSRAGSHRLSVFMECPQKFAFQYLLHLEPLREPPARALGSMVHLGTAMWDLLQLGRSSLDPVEVLRTAPARIAWQFGKARDILTAYKNQGRLWPRILDVEREFEVRARGKLHTQRFDRVIERAGHAIVVDIKSTGGDPGAQFREWELSLQMLSAELIGRATFEDVYGLPYGGVEVLVIGTRAETTFDQRMLTLSPLMVAAAAETIASVNEAIDQLAESDRDPWKYPRTFRCIGRYGKCEFTPICETGKAALSQYSQTVDSATEVEK